MIFTGYCCSSDRDMVLQQSVGEAVKVLSDVLFNRGLAHVVYHGSFLRRRRNLQVFGTEQGWRSCLCHFSQSARYLLKINCVVVF